MEYELKALGQIVSVSLYLTPKNPDAASIGKYKRIVKKEKERIKMEFIQAAFETGGETRIELYFRQHQQSLIQLSDTIYHSQESRSTKSIYRITNASAIRLYEELFQCLEYLLKCIETQFSKYFDLDIKIPDAHRWKMAPVIRSNLHYLQTAFKKNEVPEDLIKIACHPLDDFLLPGEVVTFRDLLFLKELQRELIAVAKERENTYSTQQIVSLMLYLNFNSIRFFNYYIEQICEAGKDYTDQIQFYSTKMKYINQVPVIPRLVYRSQLPSIRDQIGSWISEELYFLEKRQQILSQVPAQTPMVMENEPKVHTSLSVAHLSLAVKLLVDAKVITNKNHTELLKVVARNFRTDKREQISEDSLRNKSYNFDKATVDRMKDVIIGMMNMVMKY